MSETFARIEDDEGKSIELNRENTSVYRHLGKAAIFDHVFTATGESSGCYVWSHNQSFEKLIILAAEHKCLMHLNIPEVSDFDRQHYEKQALADLSDSFPEEWETHE